MQTSFVHSLQEEHQESLQTFGTTFIYSVLDLRFMNLIADGLNLIRRSFQTVSELKRYICRHYFKNETHSEGKKPEVASLYPQASLSCCE